MKDWKTTILVTLLVISGGINIFTIAIPTRKQQIKDESIIQLVNVARASNNLPALTENSQLDSSAHAKACDMVNNNYFAHNSPTGRTPWSFMTNAGYKYTFAEENIATGYYEPTEVRLAFLASAPHRDDILNSRVTEIGVGECGQYIVQHFGVR